MFAILQTMLYIILLFLIVVCIGGLGVLLFASAPYFLQLVRDEAKEAFVIERERRAKIRREDDDFFEIIYNDLRSYDRV